MEDRSDSNAGDARKAALKMDARTFRETGHELVDTIADLLETLPERPLTPGEHPDAVRAALGGDGLPDGGQPAAEVVRSTAEFLIEHSLYNGHPRFWGYITSSPAPIGMLADFLAAAVNPNVGGWLLSPAASEIEAQTVRWIAELTGYPVDCGGLLVSGGNVANAVG
ncbi:MAG: pyridoxal-dependent decarboxylase, partial [Rhodothermales bacterium]